MAIKNGLSSSRAGSGIGESMASINSPMQALGVIVRILISRQVPNHERLAVSSPGNPYLLKQLANFQLDQVQQFLVVDQVDLVHEHDDCGHVDLTSQQHVLLGLRHRAVSSRNDQNRAVHLGGTGDHVLNEVGVARAVDVSVVPVVVSYST